MVIGNQIQNHKKRPIASLYMKMEAFDRFIFYQNYRQRYTVIPITTVRGPFSIQANSVDPDQTS